MSQYILIWSLQSIAMLITAILLPRFTVDGPFSALKFVIALSLINTTLWSADLFSLIPNSFSAHTLTVIAANAFLFWALAKIMPGVNIDGFMPAIVGPLLFTVISGLTFTYGKDLDWGDLFRRAAGTIEETRDSLLGAPQPDAPPVPQP